MTLKTFTELGEVGQQVTTRLPNSLENTNLLIVDGNNLGFRYLKRKNFNSFQTDYIRTIESLAASYNCKDIIVAYDKGRSAYRKAIMPEYKENRSIKEEDKEHYEMFYAELDKTAADLPFDKVKFHGVEADDIIAFLILELYDRYKELWVISSDRDMYQLLKGNVHIFNMFSRKEITAENLKEEKNVTTEEYMLSRVIQGDSGDNIRGIEGIGEVRGQEISRNHKGSLEKLLAALPLKGKSKYIANLNAGKDLLIRNEKLINLSGRTREIIGFGGNDHYLGTLDNLIAPYKSYPKVEVKQLKKEDPVDIGSMERLLK